jgi:hypothetical protein
MRTETIEVFQFDELSDDAKEKARYWSRSNVDFFWCEEGIDSIKTFCNHFGVRLTTWNVAPYANPDYSAEYFNSHFRGMKLKDFKRDYMPTGYCLDYDLWMTFYDQFKATGSAKKAFDDALWKGFIGLRNDMENQLSDEYIDEHLIINEYEFTEDGKRF